MSQSITTLATGDLKGRGGLLSFGDAVRMDGFGEGRPWRVVLELCGAGKQLIATL